MPTAVSILPGPQLAVLNEAYRRAVARKRLRFALAAALFFAALVVAGIGAEVNLRTLFTYFGNFISYFDRISRLDNGSRVSVAGVCQIDPGEWKAGEAWRAKGFSIELRSADDVVLLESPPWWTLRRVFWMAGALGITAR